MSITNYFDTARKNEPIFRAILRDLLNNKSKLPRIVGLIVPSDLDTESELERLFEKYSHGERTGRFTIADFTRPSEDCATIKVQNVAPLSGGGVGLGYQINSDNSVEYKETTFLWLH